MATQYTTPYNLPYPQSGDKVADGYLTIQGIATAVNTALVNGSFPSSNPDVASITARLNAIELVKFKNLTLGSGVSLYTAGVNSVATRQGVFVNATGRFNRTSANNNVATLSTGYRPVVTIFCTGSVAGAFAIFQIATTGIITTPFSSATGDIMLDHTFVVPASPLGS